MADARFSGLYMVIPSLGVIMLFVFIMQFLIRLWMINTPQYVRKSVRFPLNEDLTDFIMSSAYPKDTPRPPVGAYVQQGYKPRTPPPVYSQQGQQQKHSMPRQEHRTEPPGYYPRQQAGQSYPREPSYDTGFPRSIGI